MNRLMPEPSRVSRIFTNMVQLCGLMGVLLGLILGFVNQDTLGWSLLRAAGLGVLFALAARQVFISLLRTWIESQFEARTASKSTMGAKK